MIYYYSATGNTRFIARTLADYMNDREYSITSIETPPLPDDDENVGIMFPIYSWGVPPVVTQFIDNLPLTAIKDHYLWALCSCGDEAGIAMRLLARHISRRRGKSPESMFSVIMPNTYVLLPGFDTDTPDIARAKADAVYTRLHSIAQAVISRSLVTDVHEGSFPALRTRLVFPLFRRWGIKPRLWHASDSCINCGRCALVCPAHNIEMKHSQPVWGQHCYSCCACFHVCPTRAIDYGHATISKSQYNSTDFFKTKTK